ncbi:zymogen granule membrane protein 16-like [Mauremys mutica]|uniref:zymogen granule membrane protein 16-like n=1 Tax=Mauremys mutica TaxID=74926 RepID=UPI001D16B81D|nr:zymogen granule membrane protein 16-like [Mauremys mutica]
MNRSGLRTRSAPGPAAAVAALPAERLESRQRRRARMLRFLLLLALCLGVAGNAISRSSFSGEYGGGGGKRFSHSGNQLDGPITAIRIRVNWLFIVGLQVRYGSQWSEYVGGSWGDLEEVALHPGESVVQASGKYKRYLRRLVLTTDRGRSFSFGKDTGTSFNAAPLHPGTVLRFLSGRAGGLIDALGFHWDAAPGRCPRCPRGS